MNRNFIDTFLNDPFFATRVNFEEKGEIICVIQPASNEELQILPEGDRFNPTVSIFSRDEINNKDLFNHNNMRYRVITSPQWSDYGYYHSLATRYEGSQTDDGGGFVVT